MMNRLEHDYTDIATHFDIQTNKSLNHYHDCLLSFKIINNFIDFVMKLRIYFYNNFIGYSVLQEETSNSNCGFYSTVNRIKCSY